MVSATSQFLTLPSQTHSGPDYNCLIEQPAGLCSTTGCTHYSAQLSSIITARLTICSAIKQISGSVLRVAGDIITINVETETSPVGEWSGVLDYSHSQVCGPVTARPS